MLKLEMLFVLLDDGDITKEIEKKKSEIAENKKELEANYNKLSNQLKEAKNVYGCRRYGKPDR